MQTNTTFAPAALPVHTSLRAGSGWARAAAGLVTLVAMFGTVQAAPAAQRLDHALEAFCHKVMPADTQAAPKPAAAALAQRYLTALSPELRQRLADQVRQEQRAGVTAKGTEAFVLRRLALYEAALQQGRTELASAAR